MLYMYTNQILKYVNLSTTSFKFVCLLYDSLFFSSYGIQNALKVDLYDNRMAPCPYSPQDYILK